VPGPSTLPAAVIRGRPTVRTYLPEGFDPALILPRGWRDYGAWVVGGLTLRCHTEKGRGSDDFFPVSSKALKRVLPPRDYPTILGRLIDAGVIERAGRTRRGGYWAGGGGRPGRCRGFRLTERFRRAPFRPVELNHTELVRKVHRLRREERDRATPGVHRHLREWVELDPDFPRDSLPLVAIHDGYRRCEPAPRAGSTAP
jgi:hypothetical protein